MNHGTGFSFSPIWSIFFFFFSWLMLWNLFWKKIAISEGCKTELCVSLRAAREKILSPADTVVFCCLEHVVCCKIQSFCPWRNNDSLCKDWKTQCEEMPPLKIMHSKLGINWSLKSKLFFFLISDGCRQKKKSSLYTWLRVPFSVFPFP